MSNNPWIRREVRARLSTDGAPCVHPDYPEWAFQVRAMDAFNEHWASSVRRVAAQPEFAELIKRQSAPDYEPDADRRGDEKLRERMHLLAFVEGCIAGWTGVTDRKGKTTRFTVAAAAEVLAAFPDILERVRMFAATPENFKPATIADKGEIIAGN